MAHRRTPGATGLREFEPSIAHSQTTEVAALQPSAMFRFQAAPALRGVKVQTLCFDDPGSSCASSRVPPR